MSGNVQGTQNAAKMGAVIDTAVPAYLSSIPHPAAKTVSTVVTVANTALAANGHRTTGTWMAQENHRSPAQWINQGNHRTPAQWFSGEPSRNRK